MRPSLPVGCIVLAGTPCAGVPPPGRHEIGAIAGSVSAGPGRLIARGLPAPNDDVVTVEETRLPGMRDHGVLPINHSGMLVSEAVTREACEFFRNGAFRRERQKVYA